MEIRQLYLCGEHLTVSKGPGQYQKPGKPWPERDGGSPFGAYRADSWRADT